MLIGDEMFTASLCNAEELLDGGLVTLRIKQFFNIVQNILIHKMGYLTALPVYIWGIEDNVERIFYFHDKSFVVNSYPLAPLWNKEKFQQPFIQLLQQTRKTIYSGNKLTTNPSIGLSTPNVNHQIQI